MPSLIRVYIGLSKYGKQNLVVYSAVAEAAPQSQNSPCHVVIQYDEDPAVDVHVHRQELLRQQDYGVL